MAGVSTAGVSCGCQATAIVKRTGDNLQIVGICFCLPDTGLSVPCGVTGC